MVSEGRMLSEDRLAEIRQHHSESWVTSYGHIVCRECVMDVPCEASELLGHIDAVTADRDAARDGWWAVQRECDPRTREAVNRTANDLFDAAQRDAAQITAERDQARAALETVARGIARLPFGQGLYGMQQDSVDVLLAALAASSPAPSAEEGE